ncbi:PREDICTED: delta(9)-fatty-acid desaturase fat-6-like, partial [Priapulus caudatus]|uniref:Delta(9)-fatty-acid desaturase fat-6-like n=1 Tax=Priapulus caudatus TaxID=37621 RepID=A0ABM1ER17_PRICU
MAPPHETDVSVSSNGIGTLPIAEKEYKVEIRWRNVVLMGLLHLSIPYSLYLSIYHVQYRTLFWAWLLHIFGGLGITVGAHRLWTHKSYKAKFPLRLFLAFLNTIALQ